jgi:hypothetical protein
LGETFVKIIGFISSSSLQIAVLVRRITETSLGKILIGEQ